MNQSHECMQQQLLAVLEEMHASASQNGGLDLGTYQDLVVGDLLGHEKNVKDRL